MQITDTHKAVKELEGAGFQPQEAETLADQQERTDQELLRHIEQAFEPRFVRLELAFEKGLRDQTWRIVAFVAAMAALTIALLGFLIRLPR